MLVNTKDSQEEITDPSICIMENYETEILSGILSGSKMVLLGTTLLLENYYEIQRSLIRLQKLLIEFSKIF